MHCDLSSLLAAMPPPNLGTIRAAARRTYELPLAFWRSFLGPSMHYHLGHFPSGALSIDRGMQLAVDNLLGMTAGVVRGARVLDVGCGWGGPASQLLELQVGQVVCVTHSRRQAQFVRSRLRGRPAVVQQIDCDRDKLLFNDSFDIILAYESLEHIVHRDRLFEMLRSHVAPSGQLLIATSCSTSAAPFELFSEGLGIQPLPTMDGLIGALHDTGWKVVNVEERTGLTLPGWEKWRRCLRQADRRFGDAIGEHLELYELAEALYAAHLLESVQIVAVPATTSVAHV